MHNGDGELTTEDHGPRIEPPSSYKPIYVICKRGETWRGLDDLEFATLEWVDWFNNRRLHGAIGYVPPAEFEANGYSSRVPEMAGTQLTGSP